MIYSKINLFTCKATLIYTFHVFEEFLKIKHSEEKLHTRALQILVPLNLCS
jgi:hypothetical protein